LVKILNISILELQNNQKIMLLHKDTNKISELKTGFTPRWFEPDFILNSLSCFKISHTHTCFSSIQHKGHSLCSLFAILLSMPYLGQSTVHGFLKSSWGQYITARKDTFYRFKNNPSINWRLVQGVFVKKFLHITKAENKAQGVKCLILDDTLLAKRGVSMEGISRVWDHVSTNYQLGYKLLACMLWDGISAIPIDFSLHRERGKNQEKPFGLRKKELKKQFTKQRETNSPNWHRMQEADASKIDIALQMIERALKGGIRADYLLMDSWFTCWAFVQLIQRHKKRGLHLIAMYKGTKTKFEIAGQLLTHHQIRNHLGKPIRCRKLGYYYHQVGVNWNGYPVKLFFSKQGKNGKWRVFITTNTSLSFIEMIKIYQIRWSIEVFFKEAKQLLGLGSCQSIDFDAQIADTTMVMIQHMLITLRFRYEHYESRGALFAQQKEQTIRQTLGERLWGLFLELIKVVELLFDGVQSDEIIEKILENEEAERAIYQLLGRNPQILRCAA
jgi:hypothetical protein